MLIRLERAVERLVEGGVARAFRLRVQPAEIGRHLERAMRDGCRASVNGRLAPNQFVVHLHPEDAAAFAGWEEALAHEMERWLAELAYAQGLSTIGVIQVRVAADGAVSRRSVRVAAAFADAPWRDAERNGLGTASALKLEADDERFPDAVLRGAAIAVGRVSGNDLVLDHPEVSRRHARIEADEAGWLLHDLDSTNGTWRNGIRIASERIRCGDEIAFGAVRYRVSE